MWTYKFNMDKISEVKYNSDAFQTKEKQFLFLSAFLEQYPIISLLRFSAAIYKL